MVIIILGEEGVRHSLFSREINHSHVDHVLAMNKNFSLTHSSVSNNVLKIRVFHIIKRKPLLHDGTVMVDLEKNRLVEIPLCRLSHQMTD